MSDSRFKTIAISLAVVLHIALGVGVVYAAISESSRLAERAEFAEENLVHIEAGLAIRSKSAKGRKTKQPQKDTQRKISPNDVVVAKDDQQKPDDKKKDDKDPKPEDEIDPEAIFKKHRQGAEGTPSEDPAAEQPGTDEETTPGRADGHDFGMFDEAKGDPYLGELNGRLHANFEVPSTVPDGQGLRTLGCVRLRPDGKVADFSIEDKSAVPAFNSAVTRSLRTAPQMEQPVPSHLTAMLVEQLLCFEFKQ